MGTDYSDEHFELDEHDLFDVKDGKVETIVYTHHAEWFDHHEISAE